MLDVHAPHEKIHGFRDFLLHLLTISIGLLIAVGIEGCVESLHHRHLRNEADMNLRQEIHENREGMISVRGSISTEKSNLVTILKFLNAKSEGKPADLGKSISIGFTTRSLGDASWQTASSTGVLSYMEYDRVQKYASAYQMQAEFTRLQTATLDDFLQLDSYVLVDFDPDKVTAEAARAATPDVRKALAHLVAMEQYGDAVVKTYDKALAP